MTPGENLRQNLREQAERGDVYAPNCPSRTLLDHTTSRWGVLVLVLLLDRPHRFGELASLIGGVSDKMLSQTLKTLVADGFVEREVGVDGPIRVTYGLTDVGRGVAVRLADLVEWLESNVGEIVPAGAIENS